MKDEIGTIIKVLLFTFIGIFSISVGITTLFTILQLKTVFIGLSAIVFGLELIISMYKYKGK